MNREVNTVFVMDSETTKSFLNVFYFFTMVYDMNHCLN
ncbi:hypothetical protein SAMN06265350_105204 [Solitalea koreensis]|uniref:Uncharacterized protein n=1 Tax=Solitalea koreensis TaxID=543615 RepID=A0A521D4E0_9SPHI|nr:hypothetical protein SAMN06265350_105204 [Solitalea koreensis]